MEVPMNSRSKFFRFSLVIFLLAVFSARLPAYNPDGKPGRPAGDGLVYPTQIHATWQQADPSGSVTITWKTELNYMFHAVKYGTEPGVYPWTAYGVYHWSPNQLSGIIHDVELTGLSPGTTYYYKCGDGLTIWSDECSFTTAPETGGFTFSVAGDDGVSPGSITVATYHSEEDVLFHVHTGDLACADGFQPKWDWWFDLSQVYMTRRPILPCIGNHEVEDLDTVRDIPFDLTARGFSSDLGFGRTSYLGRFALPGNEQWYSVDYGPIHFVMLDSDEDITPGSEQYDWVDSDLAAASADPGISWIICVLHKPPYCAGKEHGSSHGVRDNLCPLFDTYGVDVVFSGHEHLYERSYPIFDTEVSTLEEYFYEDPTGTIYVVTGGGGRWLYMNGYEYWTVYSRSKHHYVIADLVTENELRITSVTATFCPAEFLYSGSSGSGEILDEFWIVKNTENSSEDGPLSAAATDGFTPGAGLRLLEEPGIAEKLSILRDLRDKVLYRSGTGKILAKDYYAYSAELLAVLEEDPDLAGRIESLLDSLLPGLAQAIGSGQTSEEVIKPGIFPDPALVREGFLLIEEILRKDISAGLRTALSRLKDVGQKLEGRSFSGIVDEF